MLPHPLAAIVVTFRPTPDERRRIFEHARLFEHVVVVDNSEPPAFGPDKDDAAPETLDVVSLGANSGVASALNIGARRAIELGHGLAMLLDQDTQVTQEALARSIACVGAGQGITALPPRLPRRAPLARPGRPQVREVEVAITSGSILDLTAFRHCGDFEEKLFIDYVDHDYCLRLRDLGFRVVECVGVESDHGLGESADARLLGLVVTYTSHRPYRLYYIVRNGLYLVVRHGLRHPRVVTRVLRVLVSEFLKTLFLEGDKSRRLRYMGRGFRDWSRGRYGPLPEPG